VSEYSPTEEVLAMSVWSREAMGKFKKDLESLLRKMGYRYYGVKSFDPGNPPASFYVKSSEDFDLKEFLESLPDREVMPIWVNKGEE